MTPRIAADNVAEHVERQEKAVFDAAVRLFTERGYERVTLAEIAAEVGLARNSLYRYFPGKAEILVRWVNRELEAEIGRSAAVLGAAGSPVDRIEKWAEQQLRYARRPEHDLLVAFSGVRGGLDPATQAALAASHDRLRAPLLEVVKEAGVDPAAAGVTADLIIGLVHAASRQDAAGTEIDSDPELDRRLRAGIWGLLAG